MKKQKKKRKPIITQSNPETHQHSSRAIEEEMNRNHEAKEQQQKQAKNDELQAKRQDFSSHSLKEAT